MSAKDPARLTFNAILVLIAVVTPRLARADGVALANLEGATVTAHIVYDRTFRRDGQVRSNINDTELKLVIGPGDAIEQTFGVTIKAHDGRVISTRSSTVPLTLNKPFDGRN